jgi:hypothetical protein
LIDRPSSSIPVVTLQRAAGFMPAVPFPFMPDAPKPSGVSRINRRPGSSENGRLGSLPLEGDLERFVMPKEPVAAREGKACDKFFLEKI